jgi:hypothetical protein
VSQYAYKRAQELEGDDFYGLIMAAMMGADNNNLAKLRRAWPEIHGELVARYNAPGGLLPGERDPDTGDTREDLDEIRRKVGLDG